MFSRGISTDTPYELDRKALTEAGHLSKCLAVTGTAVFTYHALSVALELPLQVSQREYADRRLYSFPHLRTENKNRSHTVIVGISERQEGDIRWKTSTT
jgi:hypothetical protein